MIFYEEFLKELENAKFKIGKKENFHVDIKKMIGILGIGIALISIALYQGYLVYYSGKNIAKMIFTIVFVGLGIMQLKKILDYKILIDSEKQEIKFQKIVISMNNIESCTLKEEKLGKRIETVVDIIMKDNKQYIIPLYMNQKLKFAYILKTVLQDKFIVKIK